nr:hypothetical protein [Oceanococcus sp. HetDA_MAG_MS8]
MSGPRQSQTEVSHSTAVRRKPMLRLRPRPNRRLPAELHAEPVYQQACQWPEHEREQRLAVLLSRLDQSHWRHGDPLQLYTAGRCAYAAMLANIAAAESEILLESYIIRNDQTGQRIARALGLAARRGISVKILADAWGSSRLRPPFWEALADAGSEFRLFRRPRSAPRILLPILDHRKLLIVDRQIAYTGGMNIADEYHYGRDGMPPWRDTHIRVQGSLAVDMARLFFESWELAGGDGVLIPSSTSKAQAGPRSLLLDTLPGRGQQEMHAAIAGLLGAARQRVWISNAYFAPQPWLLKMLADCAQRGVDVRLLLPGPTDVPWVRYAGQAAYTQLLREGVRIYEYQPAVLHCKTMLADRNWGLVGSTNWDARSFRWNHECNVLVWDHAINAELAQHFEQDLHHSLEINLRTWRRRPLAQRLRNALFALFRAWL